MNSSKARREQGVAAGQITTAAEVMRVQTEQLANAMNEQTRALKDMTAGAHNVSKQVGMITRSNREHSSASGSIINGIAEIRLIAERNAHGVKDTLRSANDLVDRAQALNSIIDGLKNNGRAARKTKNKKKAKK